MNRAEKRKQISIAKKKAEFASELVGRIIKCPSCEKEIEIEDWEWD